MELRWLRMRVRVDRLPDHGHAQGQVSASFRFARVARCAPRLDSEFKESRHIATGTRLRLLRLLCLLGPHVPAGSAIEPLDRSHRLAPFEVFTAAATTALLWRRQACGLQS